MKLLKSGHEQPVALKPARDAARTAAAAAAAATLSTSQKQPVSQASMHTRSHSDINAADTPVEHHDAIAQHSSPDSATDCHQGSDDTCRLSPALHLCVPREAFEDQAAPPSLCDGGDAQLDGTDHITAVGASGHLSAEEENLQPDSGSAQRMDPRIHRHLQVRYKVYTVPPPPSL